MAVYRKSNRSNSQIIWLTRTHTVCQCTQPNEIVTCMRAYTIHRTHTHKHIRAWHFINVLGYPNGRIDSLKRFEITLTKPYFTIAFNLAFSIVMLVRNESKMKMCGRERNGREKHENKQEHTQKNRERHTHICEGAFASICSHGTCIIMNVKGNMPRCFFAVFVFYHFGLFVFVWWHLYLTALQFEPVWTDTTTSAHVMCVYIVYGYGCVRVHKKKRKKKNPRDCERRKQKKKVSHVWKNVQTNSYTYIQACMMCVVLFCLVLRYVRCMYCAICFVLVHRCHGYTKTVAYALSRLV